MIFYTFLKKNLMYFYIVFMYTHHIVFWIKYYFVHSSLHINFGSIDVVCMYSFVECRILNHFPRKIVISFLYYFPLMCFVNTFLVLRKAVTIRIWSTAFTWCDVIITFIYITLQNHCNRMRETHRLIDI